jgi:hypothetical protein
MEQAREAVLRRIKQNIAKEKLVLWQNWLKDIPILELKSQGAISQESDSASFVGV